MQPKSNTILPLLILSILSIFTLNKCSSGTQTSTEGSQSEFKEPEMTVEKSAFITIPFERPSQQSGHFFTYRFRTPDDKIDDISEFLNNLALEGFDIVSAWYFAGPNCGSSKTIYHPQLIIQLGTKDLRLNNFKFVYTTDKLIFKCTENTLVYVPHK